MPPISTVRLVALSTVVVFSLISLGLAAAFTATSIAFLDAYFTYAALAIATAGLTMLTVPAMIGLEKVRPGGPTSMIIVEISWLGFLSILWLSTGAETAQFTAVWFGCGDAIAFGDDDAIDLATCHEVSAIKAFAFLNWLVLMGYTGMLLVLSLMAANRKHSNIWTSSVANAPFNTPAPISSVPGSYGGHVESVNVGGYNTSNAVQGGTVHV
ncbi:hypothetical protein C8R47DRAFT_1077128 [Mycena vitilis]|nr:hypothetical protein C8R47DRAFT_1077128 [Mycena vitilis]